MASVPRRSSTARSAVHVPMRVSGNPLCRAAAESLPLADHCLDLVLINGIFNLNPARPAIFTELARVMRPGGRVCAAELILHEKLPEHEQTDANWFA